MKILKSNNKILFLILIIFIIIIFYFINKTILEKNNLPDALKFKIEYESLNNEINSKTQNKIRSIKIPKNNSIMYVSASDIIEKINNGESFIVYFGFAECPWCRSVIPTFLKAASDYNLSKVYYVNVKNIRDIISLDENNQEIIETKGSSDYYRLLEKFDNVLDNYVVKNDKNENILLDEKRIYAPNFIVVINGVAKKKITGISELQSDGYMELTDNIKEDMYDSFENFIKIFINQENICYKESIC